MNDEQIKKELIRHAMSDTVFEGGMDQYAFSMAQDFIDYDKEEGIFGQNDTDIKTFFLLVAEAM